MLMPLILAIGAGLLTTVLVAAHCAVHSTTRRKISRRIFRQTTKNNGTTTRAGGLKQCGLRCRAAGKLFKLNPGVLR